MRSVARSAALVGAEAVRHGVRPEVGAAKGLPGDWVTEVDLASLLVSDGRHDEAQAVIAPALVTFEGLRAVKDLAVARQVLDRS